MKNTSCIEIWPEAVLPYRYARPPAITSCSYLLMADEVFLAWADAKNYLPLNNTTHNVACQLQKNARLHTLYAHCDEIRMNEECTLRFRSRVVFLGCKYREIVPSQ